MKKLLIVGVHSYIGTFFKQYIQQNIKYDFPYEITMISASDGEWKKTQLCSFDVILHLSALVHKKEKKNMKQQYDKINHRLPVELARRFKKERKGKESQFIFFSTAAVYGSKIEEVTKQTKTAPETYYAKSKLAAEKELWKMREDSFHIAIIRPPMVYGAGCKGNFTKLVLLSKFALFVPAINNKRSMIYIENLCEYISIIIKKQLEGIYHPQDKKYICTIEWMILMRKLQGKKTGKITVPNCILDFLKNHIRIINKVFGDFYYEREIDYTDTNSFIPESDYCLVEERKALKRSFLHFSI